MLSNATMNTKFDTILHLNTQNPRRQQILKSIDIICATNYNVVNVPQDMGTIVAKLAS